MLTALLLGFLSFWLYWLNHPTLNGVFVDSGWAVNAAQDLLAGRDPYRHTPSVDLIPYPLTAAVIAFPFALLPGSTGLALLFGAAGAGLAYGVLRNGEYWRLLLFVSPCYLYALLYGQWSPLFALVMLQPVLAPLLAAKPTLALPVALSIRWTWRRIVATGAIGAISLLLMPSWPWRWLNQLQSYGGFVPILLMPGFALALLFWRSRDARFFALMTITPQHRLFYDQLLLFTLPKTARQMLALTLLSWVALGWSLLDVPLLWSGAPQVIYLIYVPALLIVLWQQWQERNAAERQSAPSQSAPEAQP